MGWFFFAALLLGTVPGDSITVTAEPPGTTAEESAASVVVVSTDEIERSAAPLAAVDDTLRSVPGFSLFRRAGSRTANPTTLGATLRGVGGTAASRALVLADGVPLGDPFGGWIHWSEVPAIGLARVEVLAGGASELHGSGALAGVVQLVRRQPVPGALRADLSGGSRNTVGASAWAAEDFGAWDLTVSAAAFHTDGHLRTARGFRGPVDVPAGSRHRAGELAAQRGPLTLRLAGFDESRDNGTPLQGNDTRRWRADARWATDSVELAAWGSDQTFRQTFSAVGSDRSSERLVRRQRVPSSSLGGRFVWRRSFGADEHLLRAGVEARRLSGVSEEQVFLASGRTIDLSAGGRQLLTGAFVENRWRARDDLTVTVGVRFDRWDDRERETEQTRHRDALSPRLAVRWQAAERWGVVASAYRSFRAPTLNELYRGFRVGDVVTDPNAALDAERLTGFEMGLSGHGRFVQGRLTLFRMDLDDPIANVTLGQDGGLVRRERRNLGAVRSQGVEATGRLRTDGGLTVRLGAFWTDTEVTDNPADLTLEGRRVPQVPEGELSLAVSRPWGRWTPSVAVRVVGDAFEDDRNRLRLPGFTDLSATLAVAITESAEIYVAGENLLDETVVVGRTPLPEVGAPRSLLLGLRWGRRQGTNPSRSKRPDSSPIDDVSGSVAGRS
jgi:outer membrane receptor protein involved in Fe transport